MEHNKPDPMLMKMKFHFSLIGLLFCACQNSSKPVAENQERTTVDSIQYFTTLDSDELLKMMVQDLVPELKKVPVLASFGGLKELLMDDKKTSFYDIAYVFYYNPVNGKPHHALVVFAEYYGEHTDEGYRLYDSHGQGPAIFYGMYTHKKNKGWFVQKKSSAGFNNAFKNYGQYGNIGDIDLVQSGKRRYALQFTSTGYGQGYSSQYIAYYDVESEYEVFSLSETTSNEGAVWEDDDTYNYSILTGFVKSDQEYYDLTVNYGGTQPGTASFRKTVNYNYEPRYGKYREIK